MNGLYLVGTEAHCPLVTGLMGPFLPPLLETAGPGPCLAQPPGVSRNPSSENRTVLMLLHPVLYSSLKQRENSHGKEALPPGEKGHYYHYRWEAKAETKMYKPFFVKIILLYSSLYRV